MTVTTPDILRRLGMAGLFSAMLHTAILVSIAGAFAGGPRTMNLYWKNEYGPGDAERLSRYDVLSLDPATPDSVLQQIRLYNPNIKILAFYPINGMYERGYLLPAGSPMRAEYDAVEAGNWWLRDTHGGHIHDWPTKYTFNLTTNCPTNASGQKFADWFPGFIANTILGDSRWDGVFLDDVWISISYANDNGLNAYPIDSDQDGIADDAPTLNGLWRAMNDSITARARRLRPNKILIGNGQNPFYRMNGAMLENFPFWGPPEGSPLGYSWNDRMFGLYGYFNDENNYSNSPARVNVVNTMWSQGDRLNPAHTPEFERRKRFCLVSSMLRDGYFCMDLDNHCSIWWEPEYEKQIGTPIGAPYQATYAGMMLWRRDYTNGVVILNSNYTTFLGSATDNLPPIGWLDARILLTSEMWHPETVVPGTVSDLAVSRTWSDHVEVAWTNVGDDGSSGQAVEVQVRYSKSPINGSKWANAAIGASIVPDLPGTLGKAQIMGLSAGQLYYFAMKTRDMSGNWSAVSNIARGTTATSDVTPPAAITDLTVVSTTQTGATVRWTSTGDDGLTGTASSFDLRYAGFPIDDTTFGLALQVVGEPVPGPAGTVHTIDLYGMTPGTTYYFAIKAGDEMPNWSSLSNIATAATLPGDTTPPAAITDLHVTGVGAGWATLEWTAPGDDGMDGRAALYDIRWAQTPITATSWMAAGALNGEPGPAIGGTIQSFTILGLDLTRSYYFAMRTADEYPNLSGLSNCVNAVTNASLGPPPDPDITPPAAITNLAVTTTTSGSATLSWTASGDDGTTGTARTYDVRYSTSLITSSNFGLAPTATSEPAPAAAGTGQSFTVTGLAASANYYFAMKVADEVPNWSGMSNVTSYPAATTEPPAIPDAERPVSVLLSPPSPNPFRTETRITLDVPAAGVSGISVMIFDVGGQHVRTLHKGDLPGGRRQIVWDGRDEAGRSAPAGVYFVVLSGNAGSAQRKVIRKP